MENMMTTDTLPELPTPTPKYTETIRGVPCITLTEHEHLMREYALQARAQGAARTHEAGATGPGALTTEQADRLAERYEMSDDLNIRPPSATLTAVFGELQRAIAKFPTWPTDPLHALAVLGEEFGELTKDVLQMSYEPGKTNAENVRKEAIQTAAMALRFVDSLDAYIYKAGEQHRQDQWKATQQAYAESGGIHPCYD